MFPPAFCKTDKSSEDNFKLQLEAPIEDYEARSREWALESAASADQTVKHNSHLLLEYFIYVLMWLTLMETSR